MANIRKRNLPSGLVRWEVAYIDGGGARRAKLFATKADAKSWLVEAEHDLKRGLHTATSVSPTVKDAAAFWIKRCEDKKLERTTIDAYRQHVIAHRAAHRREEAIRPDGAIGERVCRPAT